MLPREGRIRSQWWQVLCRSAEGPKRQHLSLSCAVPFAASFSLPFPHDTHSSSMPQIIRPTVRSIPLHTTRFLFSSVTRLSATLAAQPFLFKFERTRCSQRISTF